MPPGGPGEPKYVSNEQLLQRCGDLPGMAEQLRRQRGLWVGHLLRMDDGRLAKQLLFGKLDTTAPSCSPMLPTLLDTYALDLAPIPRADLLELTPEHT